MKVGDRVRIKEGLDKGLQGNVVDIDYISDQIFIRWDKGSGEWIRADRFTAEFELVKTDKILVPKSLEKWFNETEKNMENK